MFPWLWAIKFPTFAVAFCTSFSSNCLAGKIIINQLLKIADKSDWV